MSTTWEDLVKREPRLGALLREARAVTPPREPNWDVDRVWYMQLKPRLLELVGWFAKSDDPVLHTCDAYDVAYHRIYDALPDCRACGCMRL